ncbi:MAG TPA: hypothetical protein VFO38_01040 [Candidatus Saccharimonadales bacterium]|nr:hypothetical protein [Candidatus Saccharimonadales bacterium]
MSYIQFDEHDQAIADQITSELGDNSDAATLFQRALELGAGSPLLQAAALNWVDSVNDEPVRLPYVPLLLQHRDTEFAREFVSAMCTTERDYGQDYLHREAFWKDSTAQELFDTADSSLNFGLKLAAADPNNLITKHGSALCTWFMRVGAGKLVMRVKQEAARHLTYITSAHELSLVLSLRSKTDLLKVATQSPPNSWNLVLKAWALEAYGNSSREAQHMLNQIYTQAMDYPHQGAIIYRWLMEGLVRYAKHMIDTHPDPLTATPEQFAALYADRLLRTMALSENGWHILELDRRLRVQLPGRNGLPIVLQHDASGADAEPLEPGDKVIVAKLQLENLKPQVTPAGQIYTLPLQAARRPTEEMLAQSRHIFYVGKIRLAKWRR